jgi:hypothetical protein
MEGTPEQLNYSKERFDALKEKWLTSDFFMGDEASEFGKYLMNQYHDFDQYAFWHVLGGSSIDNKSQNKPILHEDFPGEDSVELFIDNLMNQK